MPIIRLSIDESKWPEYKAHFLLIHPNQTLNTDNPLSDDDWIHYRILLFARGAYEKGMQQVFDAQNKPPIDDHIITEVQSP